MTKALFMAAGLGSRISKDIDGLPKCLLPINNQPLLSRNIEFLESKSIRSIVAVGYQSEVVREAICTSNAMTVENEKYLTTNSIVSLGIALEKIDNSEDLLILNADVCFDFRLLDEALQFTESVNFLSDSSRRIEADYRFIWNETGVITDFGKNIDPASTSGEYIGIALIPGDLVFRLKSKIREYLEQGLVNKWWEEVILENQSDFNYMATDLNGIFWSEFDYIEDYQRAINYFMNF
jgi:choline kinase